MLRVSILSLHPSVSLRAWGCVASRPSLHPGRAVISGSVDEKILCDPVVFCFPLAMLDEVEPRLRKDLPPGHYAFASLLSERSLLELERGDLPSALRPANQAVDAQGRPRLSPSHQRPQGPGLGPMKPELPPGPPPNTFRALWGPIIRTPAAPSNWHKLILNKSS